MDEEGSLESGHESEASPALPAWAWGIPSLLSAVVVVGVLVALSWGQGSPRNLLSLKPNELGDFIAGAAGGLAFVWLTFGYFLQSREIALQRGEIALQRRETARLAQVAGLTEQHARRDTAIRSLELAIPEIYELSHLIFHHSYGSLSEDTRTRNRNVLKPQFDAGDKWIYCRDLIDRFVDSEAKVQRPFASLTFKLDHPRGADQDHGFAYTLADLLCAVRKRPLWN